MTINLKTGLNQFRNDICEVVRLFFGMPVFTDGGAAELSITHTFEETEGVCYNKVVIAGKHDITYREAADDDSKAVNSERKAVKICVYRALVKYTGRTMPWGSLTGVRPVKLYHELGENARDVFLNTYDVSGERTALTECIAANQKDIIDSVSSDDIDIYIHIPFCKTRCVYCSFSSIGIEKKGKLIPQYMDALRREISLVGETAVKKGYNPRAVYIGGGTPTAIPDGELDKLLAVVNGVFGKPAEFTVEAGRPDTIDSAKLDVLSRHGVNRISINPQTMNPATLEVIGRAHTPDDVITAFDVAKDYEFIINMDIIAGLPDEGVDDIKNTLNVIGGLSPDNITVHSLSLKRSSRLIGNAGEDLLAGQQEAEAMLEAAYAYCASIGMQPYYLYRQKYMTGNLENAGFARFGARCIYNVDIMQENVNILALGCNAISKRVFNGERYERIANPKDIEVYLNRVDGCIDNKLKVF